MPSYLITGSSRGIGLEYIRQLSVNENNTLLALVRNPNTTDALRAINSKNIHIIEGDITDHRSMKKAALKTAEITGGSLDVLINNAAFIDAERHGLTLDGYDDEDQLAADLHYNFNINCIGVVFTINAFLPLLRKGSIKKVITLSSGIGDLEFTVTAKFPAHAPYCISKAAVNMANTKYAAQYKDEGFTFIALSPGLVNTATKPLTPEQQEAATKMGASIKTFAPHFTGPISPEESVRHQLEVIRKVTVEDTGGFLSHFGNRQWV